MVPGKYTMADDHLHMILQKVCAPGLMSVSLLLLLNTAPPSPSPGGFTPYPKSPDKTTFLTNDVYKILVWNVIRTRQRVHATMSSKHVRPAIQLPILWGIGCGHSAENFKQIPSDFSASRHH